MIQHFIKSRFPFDKKCTLIPFPSLTTQGRENLLKDLKVKK